MHLSLSLFMALGPELIAFILSAPLFGSVFAGAQSSIPSPNFDLKSLGSVAIGGDFDGLSLYSYSGQGETTSSTNGSQSLLRQLPNGAFQSLVMADASITAMCSLVQDGKLRGVVLGGNFTSIDDQPSAGIALWDPEKEQVTAIHGLNGKVNALYCDDSSGTVYVGGQFLAGNSTNAVSWDGNWVNLPFAGFNGPVHSIAKNSAGHIVFGGDFNALGNATVPHQRDGQVVNLGSGNITAKGSSSTAGFDDPSNIICKTASDDGSGNTWLLADNSPGWWQGNFSFGFNPTKLRLYNTQQPNRGTKEFYFQNLNSGGILKLDYVDEAGNEQSCSSACPLPQGNSSYQDFRFQPPVGMNGFRLQITAWYGDGAGLSGIEIFQDDIYSFAIDAFNEPRCDGVSSGSKSIVTPGSGLWNRTSNGGGTTSDYLSGFLTETSPNGTNTSVVFAPDIKQSGNYSVTVYTPGCMQDDSCPTRGEVNITCNLSATGESSSTTVSQTNNFDKYDQVFYGYVDAGSDSFKPTVTLMPQTDGAPITVVAQRVGFELMSTTAGLNGLYEFDPQNSLPDTNFTQSVTDKAGANLTLGALVEEVVAIGTDLFVLGNLSADGIANVMSVNSNGMGATAAGGLNSGIQAAYANGSIIYIGGNFSSTADQPTNGLASLAIYDTESRTWSPMGAGVQGRVSALVPLLLNLTGGTSEECLTVNGEFTSVNAFDGNAAFDAEGFAVWVPSKRNWLNNLGTNMSLRGRLCSSTKVPGREPLYAGQLKSENAYSGAVALAGSGHAQLSSIGAEIKSRQPSSRKRDMSSVSGVPGVNNGMFYGDNGANITVLGGSFSSKASDGSQIQNLIFINNTHGAVQKITGVQGLDDDATFESMDHYHSRLFAGGRVSGMVQGASVQGLVVYDLIEARFASPQPPPLAGDHVVVRAVAVQPNSPNVYVGGDFASAGALPCALLCYYDAQALQWRLPGRGLTGTILSMVWVSNNELAIAGDLSINGTTTTVVMYNAQQQSFSWYPGAADLPGPVSALIPASSARNDFWAAGTAKSNGSAFLVRHHNNAWTGVGGLGTGTTINGLQMLPLEDDHRDTALVPPGVVLLLTGNIHVPSFGNASAVIFNGTDYSPFILTSRADGSPGSMSRVFVANRAGGLNHVKGHLSLGLVVLIALAISLTLMFLLAVVGIMIERQRRRREGYVPMPPMGRDKGNNAVRRIPPERLLGGLGDHGEPPRI